MHQSYRFMFDGEVERVLMMDEVTKEYKARKYDKMNYSLLPHKMKKRIIWLC